MIEKNPDSAQSDYVVSVHFGLTRPPLGHTSNNFLHQEGYNAKLFSSTLVNYNPDIYAVVSKGNYENRATF